MSESPHSPADEARRFGEGDASFRAIGGVEGVESLVDAFYRIMDEREYARTIRCMHPADLEKSRDKLARFLCGWLGGPRRYQEKYGPIRIPPAHAHLRIGVLERDAWLRCMAEAIAERGLPEDFGGYLLAALHVPADRILTVSRDPVSCPVEPG